MMSWLVGPEIQKDPLKRTSGTTSLHTSPTYLLWETFRGRVRGQHVVVSQQWHHLPLQQRVYSVEGSMLTVWSGRWSSHVEQLLLTEVLTQDLRLLSKTLERRILRTSDIMAAPEHS